MMIEPGTNYNVYLFYNKDNKIIYVGKTKRPMDQRMKEHFGSHGHLSVEILKQVEYIKYYEFFTEQDMDKAEAYLIKKHKKNLSNTKNEFISKKDVEYIKNKVEKQTPIMYGGNKWNKKNKEEKHQKQHYVKRLKQYKQKPKEILKQIGLEFVNTLKCLMSKI